MAIVLPDIGETAWGPKLNQALLDLAASVNTSQAMRSSGGFIQYQDKATGVWTNLISLSALIGPSGSAPVLSTYNIQPNIFYTGTVWPARIVPVGYLDAVTWDSVGFDAAPQPPAAVAGDRWIRRKP